jgi:MFS family permease
MLSVNEKKLNSSAIKIVGFNVNSPISSDNEYESDYKVWLKQSSYRNLMIFYILVKLAMAMSTYLMPFYIIYVMKETRESSYNTPLQIGIIPLMNYTAVSLFTYMLYKPLTNFYMDKKSKYQSADSRLGPLKMSILLCLLSSLPLAFINDPWRSAIYVCFPLQAVSLLISLNICSALIKDLISKEYKSAGFIYGSFNVVER